MRALVCIALYLQIIIITIGALRRKRRRGARSRKTEWALRAFLLQILMITNEQLVGEIVQKIFAFVRLGCQCADLYESPFAETEAI